MRERFFVPILFLIFFGLCSPGKCSSVLLKAKELSEKGRVKEAYLKLVKFKKENPEVKDWGLSLFLGNLAWQLGKKEEAVAQWQEASSLAPAEVAPLQNLGKAFFEMERFEEAARMFFRAWKVSGDSAFRLYGALSLLKAGRVKEALGHLEALRREGRKEEMLLRALLEAYLNLKKEKEAEEVLLKLLKAHPERVEYWRLLAYLREQSEDRLGSASALMVALSLKEDPTLKQQLLEAYKALGLWLAAARLLEASQGIVQGKAGALCELYLLGGRPGEALKWAKEAFARTGEKRWLKEMAEIQISLGLHEEAYIALRKEVRRRSDPHLWYLFGLCALKMGRLEEAEEALLKVSKDGKYAEDVRRALAYIRALQGKF